MKTKILAVLMTLFLFGAATYAQDHSKSHQQMPQKTEKSSEMSKQSSAPCCAEMKSSNHGQADVKTEKMDHSQMDHSQMNHSQMDHSKTTAKETSKDLAVLYTCPMHPEVKSDKPGKCPKCGMDLVKAK